MSADETKDLANVVNPKLLRRLAGERVYERGEAYFAEGSVRSLRTSGGGANAIVDGTRSYRVRLRIEDGDLDYDCTCPVGDEGDFCKHCVALGLAWHASGTDGPGGNDPHAFTEPDVGEYLSSLGKEELVSMLLDRAHEDERLHRRLRVQAAQSTPEAAAAAVWKRALDEALANEGFVPYREAYDYASGIEEVIDGLGHLLRQGQAESVIELAEHGLAEVEDVIERVDDSDGCMGGLLDTLQERHLEACRMARPDPVALAERLFELEMESSFGAFHEAVAVYAEVLGDAGRAAYRRLAEAEWAKVRPLGPGEMDPDHRGQRWRIAAIMEALARLDSDLEALVAVKSRHLSLPYSFLTIAELYRDAGDPDRALEWAERGWQTFSGERADERLRTFLADAYQRRGRHDEAMALVWETFSERPRLEAYRQLEQHAKRAGQWRDWRDKALSLVRERIADKSAEPPGSWAWMREPARDHSLLVEIHLHEGDPDAAWGEARAGGCSTSLWLALAKGRESSHPADAIGVYEDHVATLLRNTGDSVYREAVGVLEKIGGLLARTGQKAAFQGLIAEIRAAHRRKRNLLKMLDRKGW